MSHLRNADSYTQCFSGLETGRSCRGYTKFTTGDKLISRSETTRIFSTGPMSRTSPTPTFSRRTNSSILAQNGTPSNRCHCLLKKQTCLTDTSLPSDFQQATIRSPLRRHDLQVLCSNNPRKAVVPLKISTIIRSSISLAPSSVPSLTPFLRPLSPGRKLPRCKLPGKSSSSQMGSPFTSGILQDMSGMNLTKLSIPRAKKKGWKSEGLFSHNLSVTFSLPLRSFGVGYGGNPTCLRGSGLHIAVV